MTKRNTQQRRHAIVALVQERGEVSVDELTQRFATSEVTIRKDLALLETGGLLLRRYGGAVSLPSEMVAEPDPQQVSVRKMAIARAAANDWVCWPATWISTMPALFGGACWRRAFPPTTRRTTRSGLSCSAGVSSGTGSRCWRRRRIGRIGSTPTPPSRAGFFSGRWRKVVSS